MQCHKKLLMVLYIEHVTRKSWLGTLTYNTYMLSAYLQIVYFAICYSRLFSSYDPCHLMCEMGMFVKSPILRLKLE